MAKKSKKNMVKDLVAGMIQMEDEKSITQEEIINALSYAIATAYSKNAYDDEVEARCDIDIEKGTINLYWIRDIVEKLENDFDWDINITLEDALKENSKAKLGEKFEKLIPLESLSRDIVQKIKSLFNQRVKETCKKQVYDRFKELEGKITTGVVEKVEPEKYVLIDLGGKAKGFMPIKETIPGETYRIGDRIKVYVKEVAMEAKKESITVSRSDAKFLYKLFGSEIVEIENGDVYIRSIARLPGVRSKIVVSSKVPGLDAAGTCIGKSGARISKIVEQLANGQEKIDVIEYYDSPLMTIKAAMSPAKVIGIGLREEEMTTAAYNKETKQRTTRRFVGSVADVIVSDETYSLAIGVKGQNAFLTRKLSKFDKINIERVSDAYEKKIAFKSMDRIEAEYNLSKMPKVEPVQPVIKEETKAVETKVEETVVQPVETIVSKPVYTRPVEEKTKVNYESKHISVVEQETKEEVKKTEEVKTGPSKKSLKREEEAARKAAEEESKKNGMAIYSEEEIAELDNDVYDDEDVEDIDYEDYEDYYDQY